MAHLLFEITSSGCFEIIHRKQSSCGYHHFYKYGQRCLAHRHIWEECFGSIPNDLFVLHRCDNKCCINPEHLFLGTPADNSKDMVAKGRQTHGQRCWEAKLTFEKAQEIRQRFKPYPYRGINCARLLAKEFGVSRAAIYRIAKNETWRNGELGGDAK